LIMLGSFTNISWASTIRYHHASVCWQQFFKKRAKILRSLSLVSSLVNFGGLLAAIVNSN
jgi:hypothetical protein